jgi:acetyl/propionyl-CoA carboxylase alpha subunit
LTAFEAERARWEASGQISYGADLPGQAMRAGEPMIVVESMKMEVQVTAPPTAP